MYDDTTPQTLTRGLVVAVAALVALSATAGFAAAAGPTDLTVSTDHSTLEPGETTTVTLAITNGDDGVGSADFRVELSDPDVATVTDVSVANDPSTQFTAVDVDDDGSGANVIYSVADSDAQTGEIPIATVTVEADAAGSTDVNVLPNPNTALDVGDEGGQPYDIGNVGSSTITVEEPNAGPTADAGADQTVDEGATVTLDASGSSDGDGSVASYQWTQTDGPSVALSDATAVQPTFAAPAVDAATDLAFEATVTDDDGATATDEVVVTVEPTNEAPTIASPSDQTVTEGDSATVDVSASDADGDSVSLSLSQAPDFVSLSNGEITVAPVDGDVADSPYTVTVEATDGDGGTATASFQVTVNEPAAANFQVSNLQAPATVEQGDTVDVSATVENTGGQSATRAVEFRIDDAGDDLGDGDDAAVLSQNVTLAAGASEVVTFEVDTSGLAGDYAHGVFSADDGATGTIAVEAADDPAPAPGVGTTVELTPASGTTGVGATTTYEVVVTNASGGVGAAELGVTVDDPGTATVTDATVFGTGSKDVVIAADSGSVDLEYAFVDTADSGSVAVATVTVIGESAGDTSLSIGPSADNGEVKLFDEGGDSYDVTGTAGAALEVEPVSFEVSNLEAPNATARGETITVSADVTNTGAVESSQTVSYVFDADQDGTPETTVTETVTVAAGTTESVSFEVAIPADTSFGAREHGIVAPGSSTTTTIGVTPAATSGNDLPADPDGDGLYEDVNGDGDVDTGDSQALFDSRDTDATQDATPAYDFNGDGEVDAGDAQALFGVVTN